MSPAFEAFLVRLYVDDDLRSAFLADPRATAAHLAPAELAALERIDRVGLQLAAHSFAHKRASQETRAKKQRPSFLRWLGRFIRR